MLPNHHHRHQHHRCERCRRGVQDDNVQDNSRPGPRTDMDNDLPLPGSFGGVKNLRRYMGRSYREAKKFLAKQDWYTLHRGRRIRFLRRKTYSKGVADLFQIDLVNVSSLAPFNDGMRYLLTCIDVFTKRAWAVSVRTKSGKNVSEAFEKILAEQKCNMVQSDKEANS